MIPSLPEFLNTANGFPDPCFIGHRDGFVTLQPPHDISFYLKYLEQFLFSWPNPDAYGFNGLPKVLQLIRIWTQIFPAFDNVYSGEFQIFFQTLLGCSMSHGCEKYVRSSVGSKIIHTHTHIYYHAKSLQ